MEERVQTRCEEVGEVGPKLVEGGCLEGPKRLHDEVDALTGVGHLHGEVNTCLDDALNLGNKHKVRGVIQSSFHNGTSTFV